jgi:hypothetical protein
MYVSAIFWLDDHKVSPVVSGFTPHEMPGVYTLTPRRRGRRELYWRVIFRSGGKAGGKDLHEQTGMAGITWLSVYQCKPNVKVRPSWTVPRGRLCRFPPLSKIRAAGNVLMAGLICENIHPMHRIHAYQ